MRADWVCELVRSTIEPEPAACGANRCEDAALMSGVRVVGFCMPGGVLSDAEMQRRPEPALLRSLIC